MIIAHKLIIMRIMDSARDNPAGFPTERYFALRAPHLVTPADLEDTLAARRTRFGVLLEKGGGFHVVLVAYVVFALEFAT